MRPHLLLAALGVLGLAACAAEPVSLPPAAVPPASEASRPALHAAAEARSAALQAEGRLRPALWWRSIAESLADDPAKDAEVKSALAAEIAREVRSELEAARSLLRSGQSEKAAPHLARVLELDPQEAEARAELRRLDRAVKLKQIRASGAGGP